MTIGKRTGVDWSSAGEILVIDYLDLDERRCWGKDSYDEVKGEIIGLLSDLDRVPEQAAADPHRRTLLELLRPEDRVGL